jgi:hypothetical protein
MPRFFLYAFWVIYCFLSVFHDSTAQELGQPFVRNYLPKNYNAHVQNWDLVQDERGVMYFGNGDGVLEYDGVNFRLLELPLKTTVRTFAKDKNGVIYVVPQVILAI